MRNLPRLAIPRIAPVIVIALLSGCEILATKPETPPAPPSPDPVEVALQASAQDIQRSWERMARMKQADNPPPPALPEPAADSALAQTVTLRWEGPLAELVDYMAGRIGYAVKTQGRPPAIPVMVSLDADDWRIYDVLASAGLQGGTQAGVVVKPSLRQVVIIYPETGGA